MNNEKKFSIKVGIFHDIQCYTCLGRLKEKMVFYKISEEGVQILEGAFCARCISPEDFSASPLLKAMISGFKKKNNF